MSVSGGSSTARHCPFSSMMHDMSLVLFQQNQKIDLMGIKLEEDYNDWDILENIHCTKYIFYSADSGLF